MSAPEPNAEAMLRDGIGLAAYLPQLEELTLLSAMYVAEARSCDDAEQGSGDRAWSMAGHYADVAAEKLHVAFAAHGVVMRCPQVLAIVQTIVEAHAHRFADQADDVRRTAQAYAQRQVADDSASTPTSGS